jgi:hypothetical protein
MFWEIVRYGITIGLWIVALVIMWHEKPYQAQQTTEE